MPDDSQMPQEPQGDDALPSGLAAPYVLHRRIRFGESDAARIAYTGFFPQYALEAIEDWFDVWGGADWYVINSHEGWGTPFVHISLDIEAPLIPPETAAFQVWLDKVGTSSMHFRVEAFRANGQKSFTCRAICVTARSNAGAMKSIPIPDRLRARIDAYRRACGMDDT